MKKLFLILIASLSLLTVLSQNAVSVEDQIPVNNGLSVDNDTVKLGGTTHHNTVIDVQADLFAIYADLDSSGLYVYKDGLHYGLMLGNVFKALGVNYSNAAINLVHENEVNVISDKIDFRNKAMTVLVSLEDDRVVIKPTELYIDSVPVYNSDMDATTGGLITNRVYVTSDGYLKLKQ